jgi:hypothetical protein
MKRMNIDRVFESFLISRALPQDRMYARRDTTKIQRENITCISVEIIQEQHLNLVVKRSL